MSPKAMGLIEVSGMLSAITAGDAALKAADVYLMGNQTIRGGLTSVQLVGDVAAIEAAVEAGVNAVKNSGTFISSHVIPRLDEQVEKMILRDLEKRNKKSVKKRPTIIEENVEQEEPLKAVKENNTEALEEEYVEITEENNDEVLNEVTVEEIKNASEVDNLSFTEEELRSMKVTELRSLAYKHNIKAIEKSKIKYANKDALVNGLLNERSDS